MTNQYNDDAYDEEHDEDILAFDPHFDHDAKMEINLNEAGVNFEGYLALARMFTFLAQAHMYVRMEETPSPEVNTSYGYGPYHMTDYIRDVFIQNKQYLFTPGVLQDVNPEYEKELFLGYPIKSVRIFG